MTTKTPALAAAAISLFACGTDSGSFDGATQAPHEQVVETIGDTTVVRTLSGSVWGTQAALVPEVSIGNLDGPEEYTFGRIASLAVDDDRKVYVLDFQAQHVRVYDATGTHVETLGRPGEGPGEFQRANGLALLPDGRLLVRELRGGVLHVFVPGTGETGRWAYEASNYYVPWKPLYTDQGGRTFLTHSIRSPDSGRQVRSVIILDPDGTHLDTLPMPSTDYLRPEQVARRTSDSGVMIGTSEPVPFTPDFFWAVHSSGRFLTGFSSQYRLDLARDDGVLRIERAVPPVRVTDAERSHLRERIGHAMRNTEPGWSWNGPPIPEHKPFFTGLHAGRDGRIWVRVSTEGRRVENEDHDPDDQGSEPVTWEDPPRFDVFEADGTYLGAVSPPDGFTDSGDPFFDGDHVWAVPVFDGDHVWAVAVDELGVERVVRYRIVLGGG